MIEPLFFRDSKIRGLEPVSVNYFNKNDLQRIPAEFNVYSSQKVVFKPYLRPQEHSGLSLFQNTNNSKSQR